MSPSATNPWLPRFWSKVDKASDPNGCWLWTAAKNAYGYGQLGVDGKVLYAHRIAYEMGKEPIPKGMLVDHICHVRHCVNHRHLRAVTRKQNAENRRGANRGSKSGIRGVYWNGKTSKWFARVGHAGSIYGLGHFKDLHEAAEAVRLKRIELYSHNDLDRITKE